MLFLQELVDLRYELFQKTPFFDIVDDQICREVHARKLKGSGSGWDTEQFYVTPLHSSECDDFTMLSG